MWPSPELTAAAKEPVEPPFQEGTGRVGLTSGTGVETNYGPSGRRNVSFCRGSSDRQLESAVCSWEGGLTSLYD